MVIVGDSDDRPMDDNVRLLWKKIFWLVFTDFICWVPICIMSFMSFGGVIIPGIVYPITAIILVPINSVVNPWLYSSFLTDFFKLQWKSNKFKRFCFGRRPSNTAESVASHNKNKKTDPDSRRQGRNRSNERNLSIELTSRASGTGNNTTDNSILLSTNL